MAAESRAKRDVLSLGKRCADVFSASTCARYKAAGACSSPTGKKRCPATCGACGGEEDGGDEGGDRGDEGGDGGCVDQFSAGTCNRYKSMGGCSNPSMRAKCLATCGACGSDVEEEKKVCKDAG